MKRKHLQPGIETPRGSSECRKARRRCDVSPLGHSQRRCRVNRQRQTSLSAAAVRSRKRAFLAPPQRQWTGSQSPLIRYQVCGPRTSQLIVRPVVRPRGRLSVSPCVSARQHFLFSLHTRYYCSTWNTSNKSNYFIACATCLARILLGSNNSLTLRYHPCKYASHEMLYMPQAGRKSRELQQWQNAAVRSQAMQAEAQIAATARAALSPAGRSRSKSTPVQCASCPRAARQQARHAAQTEDNSTTNL